MGGGGGLLGAVAPALSIIPGVGGALGGLGSGIGGAINQAPGSAFIQNPVTNAQANTAYDQTQSGLKQQQDFLNALQGQNGIGNQTSVYNQLQGVANGTGPNPAQAMLNQQTSNNIAQQAALAAGQRGAGANAGLIARQAGMQGGNLQQQAVGQGATMQAQQSLGALGQLGGLSTQQVAQQANATQGYNQAAQSEQQNLLNSIAQSNNANVENQKSLNQFNAASADRKLGLVGNITGGAGAALAMAKGGAVPNYADGGDVMSAPSVAPIAAPQVAGPKSNAAKFNLFGKTPSMPQPIAIGNGTAPVADRAGMQIGNALGKGIKALGKNSDDNSDADAAADASGLDNKDMRAAFDAAGFADGGEIGYTSSPSNESDPSYSSGKSDDDSKKKSGGMDISKLAPLAMMALSGGGKVPAMVSPGEIYLKPDKAQKVAKGKESPKAGEKIKGSAKVRGDSLKNDTVHKNLDEGGVVIPRSIALSGNAKKMAAFVAQSLAKSGHISGKK